MGVVASVVVLCESEERAHPRQLLSPRLFMLDWPPPSVPPPSIGRLVQKRARGPERHPGLCLSTLHDGARRACFVASSPEQDRQTGGQIGNDGDFGAWGRGTRSAKHDKRSTARGPTTGPSIMRRRASARFRSCLLLSTPQRAEGARPSLPVPRRDDRCLSPGLLTLFMHDGRARSAQRVLRITVEPKDCCRNDASRLPLEAFS